MSYRDCLMLLTCRREQFDHLPTGDQDCHHLVHSALVSLWGDVGFMKAKGCAVLGHELQRLSDLVDLQTTAHSAATASLSSCIIQIILVAAQPTKLECFHVGLVVTKACAVLCYQLQICLVLFACN